MTLSEYKEIEFENISLSAKKLFEFNNHQNWINTATRKYTSTELSEEERKAYLITLDAKGRLCRRGSDFMRADKENQYPISRGFSLSINNAVILCKSCNSSKSNNMPEEFYTQKEITLLEKKYRIYKESLFTFWDKRNYKREYKQARITYVVINGEKKIFDTAREASLFLKGNPGGVSNAIKAKRKYKNHEVGYV